MRVADGDESEFSLDTWVALLAGSNPWASGERVSSAWTRLLALGQMFLVAIVACTLWLGHRRSLDASTAILVVGTLALLGLLIMPVLRVTGIPTRSLTVRFNLVSRLIMIAIVFMSTYALLPGWRTLWATPFAVAAGIDASLTCSELGWEAKPATWYRRFLQSAFHLGIVGAVAATYAVGGDRRLSIVVPLFVVLHVWIGVAVATLWIISRLHGAALTEQAAFLADVVERERRQRAHWLHDDVCAQVRLVSLKLQTNSASTEEVVGLLNDFDHQLRLRQLDELFGAGSIRLAELLQPYIRHAQNNGVQIVGVPAFEEAAFQLSEAGARLTARSANVLTANALNAGATTISYAVHTSDGFLHLAIADNGPGFHLGDVPHGRGLWTLIHDLKPGGLAVDPNVGGGTIVTATIPYTESDRLGHNSAR